ncbi:SOS response-associated peptidase [Caenimonas sedimenti]|nr:SOS response-associated peptidase family protein [Caenimonas sedimenti]
MCANYIPVTAGDRMLTWFGIERDFKTELPPEAWPTGVAPFIRLNEKGKLEAFKGHFGLLPHWCKEVAYGRRTYNARSETVHSLPSFRDAWRRGQRCIVPSEVIFEPNYESGVPVRWEIKQESGAPMGIAGVYSKSRDAEGNTRESFALVTVNADDHPLMKRFHKPGDEKRMVVVLAPADYDAWLTCAVEEAPRYFRQWMGPLAAAPRPLPPRASKGKVAVPRPDIDGVPASPLEPPGKDVKPQSGDLF